MPLVAIVIAGILLTVDKQERAWEEVRRNLSSYIVDGGDNSVMRILKLSYDHLPQPLKLCFLHFGVFFVDEEIPARDMKNLWIAEGFIYGENQNDIAEEYLKELTDRSLVIIGRRRSDGGPKTCLIHDLLRELCLKTYREEKLMRFLNNKYLENEEDRLEVDTNSTTWMCYQIEVPDMRLLRVLYSGCCCNYLSGIEYLVCLKYLVVCDFSPSISNLVNLEYLRVVSKTMVYLSSTILNMKKLNYIKVTPRARYHTDCNTSLTNKLEFLSCVVIRKVKDEEILKCSPHLHRLKCSYMKIHRVIDLRFLTRLVSLTLELVGGATIISLPSSIKKLTLHGNTNKLSRKTMSMIGRLENLEVLKLLFMHFEGNKWDTQDGEFQKLRYLWLYNMIFTEWNVGSGQHFPRLQQLELSMCRKLGEIPAEIGEIPTLQVIEVDRLLEESARRIQQEQRDMGNEDLRVIMTSYTSEQRYHYGASLIFIMESTCTTGYATVDPTDVVTD